MKKTVKGNTLKKQRRSIFSCIKSHPILSIIAIILLILIGGNTYLRIDAGRNPQPCPVEEAGMLSHPLRKYMQNPDKIIERSMIAPGKTILELGCGNGWMTQRILSTMNGKGKLVVQDIQKGMLDITKENLEKAAFSVDGDDSIVSFVLSDAYQTPHKEDTFDVVVLVTVLPEIPDQIRALKEIKRILKPGGVVAVSEMIFDPDYPWMKTTIKNLEKAGLKVVLSEGSLLAYTVTAKKV